MDRPDEYALKAQTCEKQAGKLLKGSFFGNFMSNKSERAEQALELYKQAATNYKLAKRWDDAANAYLQCVQCDKASKGGQSADFYIEAANMKQKVNTADCIKLLESAISLNVQSGRISSIAKILKRIAEIYENDNQYTLAMKYYKQAAQKFSLEQNSQSTQNGALLKVVDLGIYAPLVQYAQLIQILQKVADTYMKNKLTAPSAKELYFKSVLLYLANDDAVGANQALQRYVNNDPTFYQTRQHKLCIGLLKSINQGNIPLFSEQCYKFNEIIPLDKWKTTILTKIKATIPEGGQTIVQEKPTNTEEDDEL